MTILFLTCFCFCWVRVLRVLSAGWNRVFWVLCWSGDTRIWTGEKGFAVPRLTTRPCRQNDTKQTGRNYPFLVDYWTVSFLFLFDLDLDFYLSHRYSLSKHTTPKNFSFLLKDKKGFPVTNSKIRGKANWNH